MRYIVDTDVVIEYFRARFDFDWFVRNGPVALSLVSLGELFYGAYKSDHTHY